MERGGAGIKTASLRHMWVRGTQQDDDHWMMGFRLLSSGLLAQPWMEGGRVKCPLS